MQHLKNQQERINDLGFSGRFILAMKHLDLTIYKISQDTGMSQSGPSKWLKFNKIPKPITLNAVCSVYKLNPNWLVTGEGEMSVDGSIKLDPSRISASEREAKKHLEQGRKILERQAKKEAAAGVKTETKEVKPVKAHIPAGHSAKDDEIQPKGTGLINQLIAVMNRIDSRHSLILSAREELDKDMIIVNELKGLLGNSSGSRTLSLYAYGM